MKRVALENNEYYHIFNRGTDKRVIFQDEEDINRFLQTMKEFNSINATGGIYANSFRKRQSASQTSEEDALVEFIAYCLNPNHYHFILKQRIDNGISKFMHRLGGGYTMFFNEKNKRNGSLFQGRFKASHIGNNEYLLHLSAYVNLNDKVHSLRGSTSKSSWDEYYTGNSLGICNKDAILKQFKNGKDYEKFAKSALISIKERKDLNKLLLE